VATVRSAAQARNRRRATQAGLLLVVLGVLLALTARAGATAGELALDEADTGLSANHAEVEPEAELAEAESPDDPAPESALEAPESALEAALREALRAEGADGAVSADEPFDVRHRPRRAPPWGRLDLTVVWRRTLDEAASDPSRRGALWLLATWSR